MADQALHVSVFQMLMEEQQYNLQLLLENWLAEGQIEDEQASVGLSRP